MRRSINGRRITKRSGKTPAGCIMPIFLFNLFFGGFLVNYILSWFGKDIPFLGDALIGLVAGQFALPIAICGFILRLFGVF